ncbi:MmcB family DNA repair protein [Amaricoccus sp.]|uniref:MmcB family DNA repair protein n=1 Tax=Amaricoccus sp. TaxID=1872485 RepID=UPI00261567F7|nr:MmcB family DNA repair protein [Amaricoccus sp.]HRO12858.1 MmcB family DNA repair protein [Amaricoccus sp.]
MIEGLLPGQRLARGVSRHLRSRHFAPLLEFCPSPGLRVDVMALGQQGELWIVECKSCRADFVSDAKWSGYLPWCDRFFWAVDTDFPTDLLPPAAGLIIADAWDAEIQRWPESTPLPSARRRALVQRFARCAAARLGQLTDPDPASAPPA